METKICSKCSTEKVLEDFPYKNKELNVKNSVCKTCQREYKTIYYNNNKDTHYERNKITESKIRAYVTNIKKQGCIICKETFEKCLEFHHLNPLNKDLSIAELCKKGSLNKVKLEIDKCILLCANCHRKVHYDKEFDIKMRELITGSQSVSKTE